jgi:phosphate transport system substrate-binding protein
MRFALSFIVSVMTVGLVSCGCSGRSTTSADGKSASESLPAVNTELQGTVSIDGSSTVFLLSEAASSKFRKRYPNVSVNIGESGSGAGFQRFVKGEIDISDASRPIGGSEFSVAKENGFTFIELPIANDGLTLVIHPSNTWVDHLTIEEIKKIYMADIAAKSWSEVREGWPDKPIKPFAPGTSSGTFDYFKEVVIGKDASLRSDMSTSEDDNVIVTGVSGTAEAIGFFGMAYYEQNKDKIKAVPIVNPTTGVAVLPSDKTIISGKYAPFGRPLFIYINAKAAGRPEVKRFVSFYLEHASELAKQVGYVALPDSVIQKAVVNFGNRVTGTHYLSPDLQKRSGSIIDVFQDANRLDTN